MASTLRLRNSVVAELLLIAFVYLVGVLYIWPQYAALKVATWYAVPVGGGHRRPSRRNRGGATMRRSRGVVALAVAVALAGATFAQAREFSGVSLCVIESSRKWTRLGWWG